MGGNRHFLRSGHSWKRASARSCGLGEFRKRIGRRLRIGHARKSEQKKGNQELTHRAPEVVWVEAGGADYSRACELH